MFWAMTYGDEEKLNIIPDTEVSIYDFAAIVMLCPLILLLIAWWYIPCVWVYQRTIWGETNDTLSKKRFKCKKVMK